MNQMDWSPCLPAYTNARLDGLLDTAMDHQLIKIEHTKKAFNLRDEGAYMIDIKSSTNMTPFRKWDNSEFIDPDVMLSAAVPMHIKNAIINTTHEPITPEGIL
jgi:hypothetical protein